MAGRRKDAHEALHPETKHGANQHTRGVANFATASFAEDHAEKTGEAPRTVRLNAERGEKISERTIRDWLSRIDKDSKEARNRRIFDL